MRMGEARFTTIGGTDTRYFDVGTGPKLLLIHGGSYDYRLGIAADDWDSSYGVLVDRYRVITPDKLGAGGTDSPATDEQYTMQAVIDHLREFADVLGLDDYVVIGHSRGALPAARLAIDHPDRIRALVLLASNTLPAENPTDPPRPYFPPGTVVPTEAMIRSRLGDGFDNPGAGYAWEYIDRKLSLYASAAAVHASRPMTERAITRILDLERRVFLPDMRRVKSDTLRSIDGGMLTQPALVIWGLRDKSAPLKLGTDLYSLAGRANPVAEFHSFAAGRHLMHVEYPEKVAAVMQEFLSRTHPE